MHSDDLFAFALTSRGCLRAVGSAPSSTPLRTLVTSVPRLLWGISIGAPKERLCVQAAKANNEPVLIAALDAGCPWSDEVLHTAAKCGFVELLVKIDAHPQHRPQSDQWFIDAIVESSYEQLFDLLKTPDRVRESVDAAKIALEVLARARTKRHTTFGERCTGPSACAQLEVCLQIIDTPGRTRAEKAQKIHFAFTALACSFDWADPTVIAYAQVCGVVSLLLTTLEHYPGKDCWFDILAALQMSDSEVARVLALIKAAPYITKEMIPILRDACLRGACTSEFIMESFAFDRLNSFNGEILGRVAHALATLVTNDLFDPHRILRVIGMLTFSLESVENDLVITSTYRIIAHIQDKLPDVILLVYQHGFFSKILKTLAKSLALRIYQNHNTSCAAYLECVSDLLAVDATAVREGVLAGLRRVLGANAAADPDPENENVIIQTAKAQPPPIKNLAELVFP